MSLPVGAAAKEVAASPSDVSSGCGYMMASESSDAETVVSDIPLDEDTISEDSLNRTKTELAGNSNINASPGFWPQQQPRSGGLEGHSLTRRLR